MDAWNLSDMESVGGHHTEIVGTPKLIDTDAGAAVEFDGVGDALVVDTNPLAGLIEFTAEVIFQPYPEGLSAQRFFHIQEEGSDNRVLFETRLTANNQWFLDTFIAAGEGGQALFAEDFEHELDSWYHAAIVVADGLFRHYVNGELELEAKLDFVPQGQGQTSVGVRHNRVCWYKGAMRSARFSSRTLVPAEFLKI